MEISEELNLADQRRKKIVEFILEFTRKRHYPPTIREIGMAIGVCSTSLVVYYIDSLVMDGILGRNPGVARAIWVEEQLN